MDFAALQVFKAVVDEGGIGAAAKKLHRVQSNVTTRIQQLEASLGTQLFVREKRRLYLSPAGELFFKYAEQLLQLSEQARSAVMGDAPRGVLRVGTLESTAASRLPPLLSRYHRKYPGVRVELSTGTTDALVDAVMSRRIEGAFVADCVPTPQLEAMPAFQEELVVVASKSHPGIRRAEDVRADTVISVSLMSASTWPIVPSPIRTVPEMTAWATTRNPQATRAPGSSSPSARSTMIIPVTAPTASTTHPRVTRIENTFGRSLHPLPDQVVVRFAPGSAREVSTA